MRKDRELDEILESVKSRRNQQDTEQIQNIPEPLAPPSPSISEQELVWVGDEDIQQKLNETEREEILPDIPAPQKVVAPVEPLQEKAVINQDTETEQKENKNLSNKGFIKLVAITVAVLFVIGAVAIAVIHFDKDDETVPQITKYSYKTDILADYQEDYKGNKNIAGRIYFEDLGVEGYVMVKEQADSAYFAKNTDITQENQILAVDITAMGADIESLYSTAESYINSSQFVEFDTLFEQGSYRVVYAYYTNVSADDNNGYVFPYNISGSITQKSFLTYRGKLESRALYDTDFDILSNDKILTISVDSNTINDNYKFVIVCVKTDDNSKVTDGVVVNESPYYPQSYYDKQGIENPYKYALGWYPEIITNQATGDFKQTNSDDFK